MYEGMEETQHFTNKLLSNWSGNQCMLLVENQFGFRKGIATEDAIFKLTDEILNALNNRTMSGGIFFDLEKAFDSVFHVTPLTPNDLYIRRKLCVEWKNFVHSYSVLQYFRTLEGQAFIQEPECTPSTS